MKAPKFYSIDLASGCERCCSPNPRHPYTVGHRRNAANTANESIIEHLCTDCADSGFVQTPRACDACNQLAELSSYSITGYSTARLCRPCAVSPIDLLLRAIAATKLDRALLEQKTPYYSAHNIHTVDIPKLLSDLDTHDVPLIK